MDMRPKFAILLAAYNGSKYIKFQIDSILNQLNVDLHLFISVDLSSDGTEEIVETYKVMDSRIHILPFGERFGGAGPNFYRLIKEVNLSSFDYISFADQDDIWDLNKLFRASQIMYTQDAQGYSSNFTAFWPNGSKLYVKKSYPQRRWDFFFESAGPGCTYVIRCDVALNFQQFLLKSGDAVLGIEFHDWLIYAYARFHGYLWVIDDWSSLLYRQHLNNQLGVNFGMRSIMLRVKKILNGYGIDQSLLIADSLGANSLAIVRQGLLYGRSGFLWLSLQSLHCRRKRIDQMVFFISCLLLAIIHPMSSVRNK